MMGSNALKYAFEHEEEKRLAIQLSNISAGEYALEVKDNGVGLSDDFDPDKVKSLGLRLVKRLSRQLYGHFSYRFDQGAIFQITFKDTNQRKMVE